MDFPPSLPPPVISRAFRATNDELGIMPGDAMAFLDACQADLVEILGWELWLVDHDWSAEANGPVKAPGHWCGLIPVRGHPLPHVIHGDGGVSATRGELAELDLNALIESRWSDYIRINFCLDN